MFHSCRNWKSSLTSSESCRRARESVLPPISPVVKEDFNIKGNFCSPSRRDAMPEKTAEALERILSLSSANVDSPPSAGPSEQYAGPGGPAFQQGTDEQALLSSMFFEVVDEQAGTRPRFDSSMSWSAEYNDHDHVLEGNADDAAAAGGQSQDGDDAPWYAHGPTTYGAPHVDPYGPADKDEPGPVGPPSSDFTGSDLTPEHSPVMWGARGKGGAGPVNFPRMSSHDSHLRHGTGQGTGIVRGESGPRGADTFEAGAPAQLHAPVRQQPRPQPQTQQHAASALSEYVPQWAYETLPRDCLIMLLESALKHMPQETEVVARCMRALAPLSREEYEQCFGSLSRKKEPQFSAPTSSRTGSAGAWAGSASSMNPRHAVDIPGRASASNASWERMPPAHQGKREEGASYLFSSNGSTSHERMPPAQHQRKSVVQAIDTERQGSPPLGGAAQGASSGAGEVRKTINKAGARTSIRLTDSRVGMRTSVLTEEQAIEVFKQRPAQRTERAALCSVLADRYCVTTTAIRHIWDRRTWVWTNIPYWTKAEMAASLAEGTCDSCKSSGIDKIEDTCEHCPINRKRGRPRGARDTYRRQRKNP